MNILQVVWMLSWS